MMTDAEGLRKYQTGFASCIEKKVGEFSKFKKWQLCMTFE